MTLTPSRDPDPGALLPADKRLENELREALALYDLESAAGLQTAADDFIAAAMDAASSYAAVLIELYARSPYPPAKTHRRRVGA
jgi:hypothetical protein